MIKKIFIKIARILNYELIDQNDFKSPTLESEINQNLRNIEKSIVLPLGEVKLTKKIKELKIIFRTNTNIHIWDQNKKRIFDHPKIEYAKRSLYSLIKSIENLNDKYPSIVVNLIIVDDKSKYTDWSQREDIKAELKVALILVLADHGYPPVPKDEVYKEIFEQAENFKHYHNII